MEEPRKDLQHLVNRKAVGVLLEVFDEIDRVMEQRLEAAGLTDILTVDAILAILEQARFEVLHRHGLAE